MGYFSYILLAPVLLLVICFVTYGPVLNHPFMLDDFSFLDPTNKSAFYTHVSDFFTKTYNQHYEPLYNLINVSLFYFFRTPFSFYFINFVLFYISCVLLFYFVLRFSKSLPVALLTSILFCVHPLSGEILQHITFNNILLGAFFMLAGLTAFYRHLIGRNNHNLYIASNLFLVLALLCNEIFLLFVFYALVISFILTKHSLKESLKACVPFFILEFLFFIIWVFVVRPEAFLSQRIQAFHIGFWDYSANFFYLIIWYISNFFVPRDIVFMYTTPPIMNFIWLWNLIFLCFLSGLSVALFYFKRSIESFALVLFFTGFLIVIPAFASRPEMGFIFEPYWLYFSSIGFYLFIVLMLFRIKDRINRWLFVLLAAMIFMFFFIQTQKLTATARTQLSYCENWLRKSPGNRIPAAILSQEYIYNNSNMPLEFFLPMLNVADSYLKNGHYETATKLILKLSFLNLSYDQRQAMLCRLAVAYYMGGHFDKSRNIISRILYSPFDFFQLSNTFYQAGAEKTALFILRACRAVYPQYKDAYLLGGVILANEKHYGEAILWWKQGLKIDLTDERFRSNIERASALKEPSGHGK